MFLFDTPKNIRKHSLIEKKKTENLGFFDVFRGIEREYWGGKG